MKKLLIGLAAVVVPAFSVEPVYATCTRRPGTLGGRTDDVKAKLPGVPVTEPAYTRRCQTSPAAGSEAISIKKK